MHCPGFSTCIQYLFHIVSITMYHMPSETCPFVWQAGSSFHYIFCSSVDLKTVAIDDGNEVIQVNDATPTWQLPILNLPATPHPREC